MISPKTSFGVEIMAAVTIRNLSDETHRALKVRAAKHGRSTEAEMREILESTVRSAKRIKLGSLLASIAKEAGGLSEEEAAEFSALRDIKSAEPIRFE